eukprot:5529633-Alexandrium_andersonii.AAC.1
MGMGPEYTWSRVLVPLVWLSLPGHCESALRGALAAISLPWVLGGALAELWEQREIRTAHQLLEWLRVRLDELEMAQPLSLIHI